MDTTAEKLADSLHVVKAAKAYFTDRRTEVTDFSSRELEIASDLVSNLLDNSVGNITQDTIVYLDTITGINHEVLSHVWESEIKKHEGKINPLVLTDKPGAISNKERTFIRNVNILNTFLEQGKNEQEIQRTAYEMGFGSEAARILRARKQIREAKVAFGNAKFTSSAQSK